MKNKKWITLAAAVVLAVTSLPVTVLAEKKYQLEGDSHLYDATEKVVVKSYI